MAAAVSPVPRLTFFANDGSPLAGGTVTTYLAGTLTLQPTYSDTGLSVPISNPIVLNAAGRPQASATDATEVNVYLSAVSYKFLIKDANGNTIDTPDNVPAVAVAGANTGTTLVSPIINTSILSASALLAGLCGGRLTLTSGTPVTEIDVTAATTIYFTPYGTGIANGNIGLYDGSSTWTLLPFTEKSIALGTLTASLPYDVFAYNNGGTVALRAPVAWTNTTTRATALTTQNGILVKTGATTDRYLGTFYTTATTTTEDSFAKRDLWNYYNRVDREMKIADSTANWSYNTATVRQVRAQSANQVECVIGVAEVSIAAWYCGTVGNDNAAVQAMQIGIGLDSTTTYATNSINNPIITVSANAQISATSHAEIVPAVGYHYLAMLEKGSGTGTTTWYGTGTYPGSATLLAVVQG